jgi:hypothetical protein
MGVTAPSIEADRARGLAVVRRPYGMTEKDVHDTVIDIAKKIREGMRTPSIRSLAGNMLRQSGSPDGVRARAQAVLDFVRSKVTYVNDPELVEFVQGATVTLCVDGAPICIPIGDCDDLVVATGSMLGALGLETRLIVHDYGPDQEMHILLGVLDEQGRMLGVDPSKRTAPVGAIDRAVREAVINPTEPGELNMTSSPGEFVSIGRPKLGKPCCAACAEGKPCTGCGSRVHPCPCETGRALSRRPMFSSLGAVSSPDYTQSLVDINAMALALQNGDTMLLGPTPSYTGALTTYQNAGLTGATTIGPEIDAAGLPSVTQAYTQQAWRLNGQLAALTGSDLTTAQTAQNYAKSMLGLYQGAVASAKATLSQGPKANNRDGLGTVITLSVVGGLLYVGWRMSKNSGRRAHG